MVKRVCGGSSNEVEWAKDSANKWGNRGGVENLGGVGTCLHSQILRIRAEDSHIGEDVGGLVSFCAKDDKQQHLASLVLFSRPILPSSPLAGKTIIHTAD